MWILNVKFNASTWNLLSLVILSVIFNVSVLGFSMYFCLKTTKTLILYLFIYLFIYSVGIFVSILSVVLSIGRFSYDLKMKTREQKRNNKRKEIELFD